jgi:hypothetical protein
MLRRLSATVRWDILDGDRIEHRLSGSTTATSGWP